MTQLHTAASITDEQIRELELRDDTTPAMHWECQIARRDHRIKLRANKTKARVEHARARCADLLNRLAEVSK